MLRSLRTAVRRALAIGALALLALPALIGQEAEDPALAAAKKQAIVDEVAKLLEENYIFPETSKKLEAHLRTRLKNGDYDKLGGSREFAEAVSQDLLAVGKDKHMGFAYAPERAADIRRLESRSEDEAIAARERRLAVMRSDNFGFRKVERLPGNIGYLDFRFFGSADEAGPTMIAAMNFLAFCDAVIVDLRQNGGGDTTGIQLLCSYFFSEMTHLNDIRYRDEAKDENYWTLPYVPGPKPVNADLYILTSSRTFSGAEEFSYNMKNLKRGTIVGETTGGGAHPTDAKIVQNDFILRVPFARAVNPYSKTNWEGTGVAPDVQVQAAEAFDRAYRMAVEKLAAKAADPMQKAQYEWIISGLDAKANPAQVEEMVLKTYAGVYGERKVTFENGALFYQRTGPKFRLKPMTRTLFAVEGLDDFRVEFTVKDGQAVELVGLYDDGGRQPSPRTK
jgi:retinol-binding protein 3